MVDNLKLNQSTPVAGLGTQNFTVTTAGLYTVQFKSFLPYLAAGSPPVTTNPSAASTDITLVADSSGSLNSTYFTFNSAGDLYQYYVWFNINSAGVDPAVAGRIGIQVAGATNVTAANLATATRAAISAAVSTSLFTVGGATIHVILTNVNPGLATAAANGTASPGFSYSATAGTYGVPVVSGLDVVIKQNSTILARYGFPSPTQPIMGGSVIVNASLNDVLGVVLSSLSAADSALNAVKTIINLYQGE